MKSIICLGFVLTALSVLSLLFMAINSDMYTNEQNANALRMILITCIIIGCLMIVVPFVLRFHEIDALLRNV